MSPAWSPVAVILLAACAAPGTGSSTRSPRELEITFESSVDGTEQPARLLVPAGPPTAPTPLLVFLHSWSRDYTYRETTFEQGALERGWFVLCPDFRGPNDDPDACGSEKARRDVLDALAWVRERYPVDPEHVYLTGISGGAHMTLLMVGRHPGPWTAASAWAPPTDLVTWHERHANGRYGRMVRASTGGPPGASAAVDREYRERSPIHWLAGARGVRVEIATGIRDGHEGSVPIDHTLRAFNVLARANGGEEVSEAEIAALSEPDGRVPEPRPSDRASDPTLGRAIHLRRTAGPARVTIFEGGHEGFAEAALDWLAGVAPGLENRPSPTR